MYLCKNCDQAHLVVSGNWLRCDQGHTSIHWYNKKSCAKAAEHTREVVKNADASGGCLHKYSFIPRYFKTAIKKSKQQKIQKYAINSKMVGTWAKITASVFEFLAAANENKSECGMWSDVDISTLTLIFQRFLFGVEKTSKSGEISTSKFQRCHIRYIWKSRTFYIPSKHGPNTAGVTLRHRLM